MSEHPPASPASPTKPIPTTINRQLTTTTTTTSTSSSPNSSPPSSWTRRELPVELDDSPTPSPRTNRLTRRNNNRDLNLTLNINLDDDDDENDTDEETEREMIEIGSSSSSSSSRMNLRRNESLEILSSGLEQLEMDSTSSDNIRGKRPEVSSSTSSATNWLKRASTIEGLIDNDLIEEHWYSMNNTLSNTPIREEESFNLSISGGNGESLPLDGEEGILVDDEACFVDYDGCVDFISSLPYELSLYILLHLERPALIASTEVSRQWRYLALDNLIWRDLFHRESRWRIREDVGNVAAAYGYESVEDFDSNNGTSNGTPLRRNSSATSSLRGGLNSLSSSTVLEETISTATPRRPASGIINSPFLPSINTSTFSRNSRSNSIHQQQPTTPQSYLSRNPSFTTLIPQSPFSPNSTILPQPSRRASSASIPPLGFVPSPSFGLAPPSAPLFLDWPTLYKDRFILEKRWEKGQPKSSWLNGHEDSVYCIQYDEGKVISGSRDQTIRVWDIKTRQCIKVLKGHSGSVLCLQYDDKVLISGSSDSRILIWDLVGEEGTGIGKWEIKASLLGHQMGVLDLCFDDKWIVTCSKDTTIRVWDKETGQHYRTLSGHRGPINALQLLNDKVVSASGDGTIKLWSVLTGEVIRVFTGHTRGLACVQYSPSGKLLASGSNDKTIKIWEVETGACLKTFRGHKELVRTLCFDETRRRLVSGSYDKTIKVWDLDNGDLLLSHTGHTSLVFDVSFSASKIVSCSHDHRILILDFGWGLNVSKFV